MSRDLAALSYRIKPTIYEFLAKLIEAQLPVLIVTTGRTLEEQKELYAQGRTKPGQIVTWTMDSKHLPQPPDMKSLAIDIVPYEIFQLHGDDKLKWDATDPAWQKIGDIGERLGLKWGVILADGKRRDIGHFEYKAVQPSGRPQDDFVA